MVGLWIYSARVRLLNNFVKENSNKSKFIDLGILEFGACSSYNSCSFPTQLSEDTTRAFLQLVYEWSGSNIATYVVTELKKATHTIRLKALVSKELMLHHEQ